MPPSPKVVVVVVLFFFYAIINEIVYLRLPIQEGISSILITIQFSRNHFYILPSTD